MIVLIFALFGCRNMLFSDQQLAYNLSKDTFDYFGDGRFQMIVDDYEEGNNTYELVDLHDDNSKSIEFILNYVEIYTFVYTIGARGYTKLNFNTGDYQQSSDIQQYKDVDRNIFQELERTKAKFEKRYK